MGNQMRSGLLKGLWMAVSLWTLNTSFAFAESSLQEISTDPKRPEQVRSAVEALSTCGELLRWDLNYVYTSSHSEKPFLNGSRTKGLSSLLIKSIDNHKEFRIEALDRIIDVVPTGNILFLLTPSAIEEWEVVTLQRIAVHPLRSFASSLRIEEEPQAFALYGNKLVIAHGLLGVSFFDLRRKIISRVLPVVQRQKPLASVVNGIAVSGNHAFAVIDSHTLVNPGQRGAFKGIVVIDLQSEKVISELDGMDPGAESVVADSNVAIVSFYGQPLWKYSISALQTAQTLPSPLKRFWRFPNPGRQIGKASLDQKYYYTCFDRMPGPGEGSNPIRSPLVLDRRVYMLN